MKPHYFVGNVLHSGQEFKKGAECPAELMDEFKAKKFVSEELPDPKLLTAQQRLVLAKKQLAVAELELKVELEKKAAKEKEIAKANLDKKLEDKGSQA